MARIGRPPARLGGRLVQLPWQALQLAWGLTLALFGFWLGFMESVLSPEHSDWMMSGLVTSLQMLFAHASLQTMHVLWRAWAAVYRALLPMQCTEQCTPQGVRYLRMRLPHSCKDPDLLILHIHGGAMVSGTPAMHMPSLLTLMKQLQRHGVTAETVAPDYSLAPEHPFPKALDEVCSTIQWLHHSMDGPDTHPSSTGRSRPAILLLGDSAGGNLALASLLALHRRSPSSSGRHPTTVAGAVLISPWLNLSSPATTGCEDTIKQHHIYPCQQQEHAAPARTCSCVAQQLRRMRRDILTPESLSRSAGQYTQGGAAAAGGGGGAGKGAPLTDPLVSPSLAAPEECVAALRQGVLSLPVLVTAGADELLLPDIVQWHDQVGRSDPGVVRLITERRGVHNYLLLPGQEHYLTPVVEYIVAATRQWAECQGGLKSMCH